MPRTDFRASIMMDSAAVQAALKRLLALADPDAVQGILEDAGRRMGRSVRLDYPPPTGEPLRKRYTWANGTRSKFKSHRHQRAFFAMLKSGKIRVPYRRTGRLGRAVVFRIKPQASGVEVAISVNEIAAPYARLVVGRKQDQSAYFRRQTRWKPLRIMLADQREQMADALAAALQEALQKL